MADAQYCATGCANASDTRSIVIAIVEAASFAVMLYIIGLGLADERDITVKGLEAVRSCQRVYLEAYTSILGVDQHRLEEFYGRDVIVADREMVESNADLIIDSAAAEDVAFLVVGDPFACVVSRPAAVCRERF